MAKKKLHPVAKAAIIIGSLTAIGALAVVIQRQIERNKDKKDGNGEDEDQDLSLVEIIMGNTPTSCRHCNKTALFPLQKGSKGKQVAAVQYGYNQLNKTGDKIIVDGDWGAKTEKALQALSQEYAGEFTSVMGPSGATGTGSGAGGFLGGLFGGGSGSGTSTTTPAVIKKYQYRQTFKQFENI